MAYVLGLQRELRATYIEKESRSLGSRGSGFRFDQGARGHVFELSAGQMVAVLGLDDCIMLKV